jgi:hypothetical protein
MRTDDRRKIILTVLNQDFGQDIRADKHKTGCKDFHKNIAVQGTGKKPFDTGQQDRTYTHEKDSASQLHIGKNSRSKNWNNVRT